MNDIYIRNYDDNGYNIEDMNVQIGKSKLKEYNTSVNFYRKIKS